MFRVLTLHETPASPQRALACLAEDTAACCSVVRAIKLRHAHIHVTVGRDELYLQNVFIIELTFEGIA